MPLERQRQGSWGLFGLIGRAASRGWSYWVPTSDEALDKAEEKLLSLLRTRYESRYVEVSYGYIWTLNSPIQECKLPLVLVHGLGAGSALWLLNLDQLSEYCNVYAFDLLGFGKSARPPFPTDAREAEDMFVSSIEEWRSRIGLQKFIMVGHSLGGFLAASYALMYPQRLLHLVLIDPWGFSERPPPDQQPLQIPLWVRAASSLLSPFNPLAVVRVSGPLGPSVVQHFRPDFRKRFASLVPDESIYDYIYHINVRSPTGEDGFRAMTMAFGWARLPMLNRVHLLDPDVPITLICGARSWVDSQLGEKVQRARSDANVDVRVVKESGHHVYADQPEEFNSIIRGIIEKLSPDKLRSADS